jgi:tetratricopeptide (TPR) repeat protein
MTRQNTFFILTIILATIIAYANSLNNQFIWDDEDWILRNATVKDWRQWPILFTQNSIEGARKGSNFYRPLQAISHGIDYLLWQYNLPYHHITNILLHVTTAMLLFLLLKNILSQDIAFLSALFFAIHPVQTEAVTYISGRADPLSSLFIFLAILLFEKNLFLLCGAFIFAILSKESALITPFLILLYIFYRGKKIDYKKFVPFVLIAGLYALLRLTVLDFSHTIPESAPKAFFYVPFYIRLCTFLKTLPVYFKILLWPFGLHMERDISLSYSIFEPQTASGLFIITASFLIGYALRKKHRFLLFSSAWFSIAIFPNSNIFPINALIYEHWLYLPSVGFFIAISWVLQKMLGKPGVIKSIAIILIPLIALFYVWRTSDRNKDWRNPISFYESTLKYKPDSARLHNNLAMAYADAEREEDAIREYKKAIECGDYYPQTHYNLSNIYIKRGNYETAISELKKSIEIDNNFLYSHESLAQIYFNQGKFAEAKKEALFILEREPRNIVAIEILNKI